MPGLCLMETLQILLFFGIFYVPFQKYGKCFSALLEYFFKHIFLISKECAFYCIMCNQLIQNRFVIQFVENARYTKNNFKTL